MRRHRRRHMQGEVELNLAAMLDMAFQLLAFFILTFKPSPVEGELQLRLPPPVPVANTERPPEQIGTDEGQASANTLMISIMAGPNGSTSAIQVANDVYRGPASQANLHQLDRRLRDVFGFAGTPFDQVLIRVAPGLKYEDLMKVIDVCTRQKMADGTRVSKLSFVELPEAPGAGE